MNDDISWDGDSPSADPAIRMGYEAALGRFILAFNEADYRLSRVIAAELSERGHPDLGATASKAPLHSGLRSLRSW
jgi:hypothetical protein